MAGFKYSDVVGVPVGFAGMGVPQRGVHMVGPEGVFVKYVPDERQPDFMARSIAGKARVLPV